MYIVFSVDVNTLLKPKSASFRLKLASSSRFSGFRSRWTTPLLWQYPTPAVATRGKRIRSQQPISPQRRCGEQLAHTGDQLVEVGARNRLLEAASEREELEQLAARRQLEHDQNDIRLLAGFGRVDGIPVDLEIAMRGESLVCTRRDFHAHLSAE